MISPRTWLRKQVDWHGAETFIFNTMASLSLLGGVYEWLLESCVTQGKLLL